LPPQSLSCFPFLLPGKILFQDLPLGLLKTSGEHPKPLPQFQELEEGPNKKMGKEVKVSQPAQFSPTKVKEV